MSEFEKDSAFKQSEDRMNLRVWKAPTDPYDHAKLAENFKNLDMHDGTRGTPILPTMHMAAVKKESLAELRQAVEELAFRIDDEMSSDDPRKDEFYRLADEVQQLVDKLQED